MTQNKTDEESGFKMVGGSLQIEEDLRFQKKQWVVQRVGWVLMWAAALAGLAGLLGRGPLSTRKVADPTGAISVEFDRFQRANARSELHLEVAPGAIRDGKIHLRIDDAYLSELRVEAVTPTPLVMQSRGDHHVYTFAAETTSAPVRISIHYEHESAGTAEGRIGLAGGPDVMVSQFVYP